MEQECCLNYTVLSIFELDVLADLGELISKFLNGLVSSFHPLGLSEAAGATEAALVWVPWVYFADRHFGSCYLSPLWPVNSLVLLISPEEKCKSDSSDMLPVTGFGQATCKHVHQVLAVVNNSSAMKYSGQNLLSAFTKYCVNQNCIKDGDLCWCHYKSHFSKLLHVYK